VLLPGFRLGLGFKDGHVELWDIASGRRLWSVTNNPSPVAGLDASAVRNQIAVGHADGQIKLIAFETGKVEKSLTSNTPLQAGLEEFLAHVQFSSNGQRLLAMMNNSSHVSVWDLERGVKLNFPVPHREGIVSAVLSHDGRWVITASFDAHAILSDVDSGQELARCSGQFVRFSHAAFSPDKTRLALVGEDGSLSIWNPTGQRLASFRAHPQTAGWVAWSNDGDRIVTVGWPDGFRIWRAPTLEEIAAFEAKRK
jgi:WD40 repeat protein